METIGLLALGVLAIVAILVAMLLVVALPVAALVIGDLALRRVLLGEPARVPWPGRRTWRREVPTARGDEPR